MRLSLYDFIVFFTKQHTESIILEKKTIRDKVDEKRVKICAIHKCIEITIVAESMIYF